MSDLIARLENIDPADTPCAAKELATEAAREIERLEAANEELVRGMTEMAERFTAVMAPYLKGTEDAD